MFGHKILLACVAWLCGTVSLAQKAYGVEQDCYFYHGTNRLVPRVYYRAANGWYGQLRYNYEEDRTLSLFAGKELLQPNKSQASITPQLGVLAGRFSGISAGLQAEARLGLLWVCSEPQYAASFDGGGNFFYHWTEVGFQPARFFYTGFALQQTKATASGLLTEPGMVIGFAVNKLELPVYYFRPAKGPGYFVFGLHLLID